MAFGSPTDFFVVELILRMGAWRGRANVACRLDSVLRDGLRLAFRASSLRAFFSSSYNYAKSVGRASLPRDRALNPFGLQNYFFLPNFFGRLLKVNINDGLRFVVGEDNGGVEDIGRYHVRVGRRASRIRPSSHDNEVTIQPVASYVGHYARVVRQLVVLANSIVSNSLFCVVPLAGGTISEGQFFLRGSLRLTRNLCQPLFRVYAEIVTLGSSNGRRASQLVFRRCMEGVVVVPVRGPFVTFEAVTVCFRSWEDVQCKLRGVAGDQFTISGRVTHFHFR